ncbi:hypothetical protein BDN71DRAFT_808953 [Pleurotus eryngii]|uniref:Uncharacterized protein n=1 Tax=Pleurotus eryngii TaxID=5323 RepID=A0A9P5ZXS2_PLEER|nr:hypothetical protein BDN71DRAFT_808953 [Pleurotus eryngii]
MGREQKFYNLDCPMYMYKYRPNGPVPWGPATRGGRFNSQVGASAPRPGRGGEGRWSLLGLQTKSEGNRTRRDTLVGLTERTGAEHVGTTPSVGHTLRGFDDPGYPSTPCLLTTGSLFPTPLHSTPRRSLQLFTLHSHCYTRLPNVSTNVHACKKSQDKQQHASHPSHPSHLTHPHLTSRR